MKTTTVPLLNNLPTWALLRGLKIDGLRALLKKRPDLQLLGQAHGPMKLFTAEEFDVIAAAYAARTDGRKLNGK